MKKRFLSAVLAILLCLTMLPQALAQPATQTDAPEVIEIPATETDVPEAEEAAASVAAEEPAEELAEEPNTVTVGGETYKLNYHDLDFAVDTPSRAKSASIGPDKLTDIPSYSSVAKGNVTPPKNQNPYGTCWAFSATAVAETSCYVHNGGKLNELSQLQLAYFFYYRKLDPLGNADGDETIPILGDDETFSGRRRQQCVYHVGPGGLDQRGAV